MGDNREELCVLRRTETVEGTVKERAIPRFWALRPIFKPQITLSAEWKIATMPINRVAYFNYKVDDIDKRQAVGGIMEALSKEASETRLISLLAGLQRMRRQLKTLLLLIRLPQIIFSQRLTLQSRSYTKKTFPHLQKW